MSLPSIRTQVEAARRQLLAEPAATASRRDTVADNVRDYFRSLSEHQRVRRAHILAALPDVSGAMLDSCLTGLLRRNFLASAPAASGRRLEYWRVGR